MVLLMCVLYCVNFQERYVQRGMEKSFFLPLRGTFLPGVSPGILRDRPQCTMGIEGLTSGTKKACRR
jgi:hypothetical protein